MKIQCDVCEKAPAAVICCADEAALCPSCDVEVHAANKLASKHQRLRLECLPNGLPRCDICQEKAAFIFCVEDRALFCRDCDEPVHVAGTLSGNHQRYLATGIRVAVSKMCNKDLKDNTEPPRHGPALIATKVLRFQVVHMRWSCSDPTCSRSLLLDLESWNGLQTLVFSMMKRQRVPKQQLKFLNSQGITRRIPFWKARNDVA